MSARLTRAKRKIAAAGVAYRVPPLDELPARLGRVLLVIYLVFTEGYAATTGSRLTRPVLCDEAIRLGTILHDLLPDDPEVSGLLALMVLQHARSDSRSPPDGELVLLADQDRRRWRHTEIERGLDLLASATAAAGSTSAIGAFLLQAGIAAEHVRSNDADATDWNRIAELYRRLEIRQPTPVVRLNQAVAIGQAGDPAAALDLLDGLEAAMPSHHLLAASRAEQLHRLGRRDEALDALRNAVGWAGNDVERRHLARRVARWQRD